MAIIDNFTYKIKDSKIVLKRFRYGAKMLFAEFKSKLKFSTLNE